jgi:transcriptional regulator
MYIPTHFHEHDPAQIASILQAAPLACIVAQTEEGLIANHLPLLVNSDGSLFGHVALNNDMHRLITAEQEVMAIFKSADAYVSPNDYPSKQSHHRNVPTWNYQVAHAYGTISFLHDEKSKRASVGQLTQRFERQVNGTGAWRMADAPKDYLDSMLGSIVAFRFNVTRILAKSKLSQNREALDFEGAVQGLKSRGSEAIATAMQNLKSPQPAE